MTSREADLVCKEELLKIDECPLNWVPGPEPIPSVDIDAVGKFHATSVHESAWIDLEFFSGRPREKTLFRSGCIYDESFARSNHHFAMTEDGVELHPR